MAVQKLVAASEAGFISIDSLTPDKPRGTTVPLLESSPHMATKQKRSKVAMLVI